MKYLIAVLLSLPSFPAFAADRLCYSQANSDVELRLDFDKTGLTGVVLANTDWGSANLQAVRLTRPWDYEITPAAGGGGIAKGSVVSLHYEGYRLRSVSITYHKATDTYLCD